MEQQALGWAVAFTAGVLSFLSPCVLPLVPSYASFITGLSLTELTDRPEAGRVRRTVFGHGLAFVSGFSAVFIMLGASATLVGGIFAYYGRWFEVICGTLLVVFGALLLGLIPLPAASRDWRHHLARKPVGFLGTALVGVAFGAGWTPCIGPVLGGILTLAATSGSVGQGMALLTAYSAGLAVPFLVATVALERFLDSSRRLRQYLPWVTRITGGLLIVVGLILASGGMSILAAMLVRFTPDALLQRL